MALYRTGHGIRVCRGRSVGCYNGGMNPKFSFGLVADCQYTDTDDTEYQEMGAEHHTYYNYNRRSPQKLQEAVGILNEHDLAFIVHLGDFTNSNLDDADVLLPITDKATAEVWHVFGNHDVDKLNGNYQLALDKYRMPDRYYSKNVNGYRLVILDTCEVGVMESAEGSEAWNEGRALLDKMKANGAVNAYDWNGGLSREQLTWLDKELSDAAAAGERVIIFAHHPVFPPGNLNALNQEDILDVIDTHDNIVAFINGHHHCGAFGTRKGIPYVTVPGMVNGATNAFGVANVYDDRIEIKGYGRVEDMVLSMS